MKVLDHKDDVKSNDVFLSHLIVNHITDDGFEKYVFLETFYDIMY